MDRRSRLDYRAASDPSPPQPPNAMPEHPMENEPADALAGLRRLTPEDLAIYRQGLDQTRRICWQQFFPFLYFHYGTSKSEDLLIEEREGSVCLFKLDRRDEKPQLSLYFLPMPMNAKVLRECLERVRTFNGNHRATLYWVDEEDIGLLAGLWDTLRFYPMHREYLYDPKIYRHLAGKKTRDLRHNLSRVAARNDVSVRPFAPGDAEVCLALMDEWAGQQRDKYGRIAYQRYTKNCLRHNTLFPAPDLIGKVVLVDGQVKAFGFAGEIRAGLANLFITYSDLAVSGLNRYLIYQFMLDLEACDLVNSAMADTPGLVAAKESLCPVAMHGVYRVHVGDRR